MSVFAIAALSTPAAPKTNLVTYVLKLRSINQYRVHCLSSLSTDDENEDDGSLQETLILQKIHNSTSVVPTSRTRDNLVHSYTLQTQQPH